MHTTLLGCAHIQRSLILLDDHLTPAMSPASNPSGVGLSSTDARLPVTETRYERFGSLRTLFPPSTVAGPYMHASFHAKARSAVHERGASFGDWPGRKSALGVQLAFARLLFQHTDSSARSSYSTQFLARPGLRASKFLRRSLLSSSIELSDAIYRVCRWQRPCGCCTLA